MQPFSPRNYIDARGSFDDAWCEVARAMVQATTPSGEAGPSYWADADLPPPPETLREVTLAQLERFLRHPVRYFVNTRLKVYLREEAIEEDDEVFTLDGLQRFDLKQRLVEEQLLGRMPSLRSLVAEGILPHGPFAALSLESESNQIESLIDRLAPFREQRAEQMTVDLTFDADVPGPRRLVGQITGLFPDLGLLRYRASVLKGAEILALWLAHLAWCASGAAGEKRSSLYTTEESFVIDEALAPTEARTVLSRYLHWYWQGLHRPLLLLPKASFAYAAAANKGGRADPGKAAWSEWQGNAYRNIPGDKDDAYIQLVMRGVPGQPLEHPDFPRLAGEFYDQVLGAGGRR
jgi:exodeoxyribonuclease V gamma subunit